MQLRHSTGQRGKDFSESGGVWFDNGGDRQPDFKLFIRCRAEDEFLSQWGFFRDNQGIPFPLNVGRRGGILVPFATPAHNDKQQSGKPQDEYAIGRFHEM
jgi:hypothetical protein